VRSFRLASARTFRGTWSAIQSGASSVGPSKHVGGKDTAVSIAESPVRRRNALRSSHIGPFWVRIISFAVSSNRPWKSTQKVLGTGRRPGSKPPLRVSRARRWPGRDREGRRFLRLRRFRRCNGRLNATQPGVLAVSTSYIRGLGAACKGSATEPLLRRLRAATLDPFHRIAVKVQLTLRSLCGK
jgi:hypothetical protein